MYIFRVLFERRESLLACKTRYERSHNRSCEYIPSQVTNSQILSCVWIRFLAIIRTAEGSVTVRCFLIASMDCTGDELEFREGKKPVVRSTRTVLSSKFMVERGCIGAFMGLNF